jgi:hypothetical protein
MVCAVYGTHPDPEPHYTTLPETIIVVRDMSAPLAWLVDELDGAPFPEGHPRLRRADYRQRANVS